MPSSYRLVLALIVMASLLRGLFADAVFLGETRNGFLKTSTLFVVAAAVYLGLTYPDLQLIQSKTQYDYISSYGVNVLPLWFGKFGWSAGWIGRLLCACFLACLLYVLIRRNHRQVGGFNGVTDSRLAAFRIGSAIFIGTYMFGSNWDYRLMFLLLTIPQLTAWATKSSGVKRIARAALGCVMFMLWNALGYKIISDNAAFILDEAVSWTMLLLLGRLFVFSLPAWVALPWCGRSHSNPEEVAP